MWRVKICSRLLGPVLLSSLPLGLSFLFLALPRGRASLSPVPAWLEEMSSQGLVILGIGAVTISLQSCCRRKREPCSPPVLCPELGCVPWPWWHRRLSRAVVWGGKQRKVHG